MPTERGHHSWCALTDDNHRGACEAVAENKVIHREARPVPAVDDRPMTEQPCLFGKMPEAFYCRIHADVRLALTDERCRRGAAVSRPALSGESDASLRDALTTISEGTHPNGHRGAVEVARRALGEMP